MADRFQCTGCARERACQLVGRCLDAKPLHDDYKQLDHDPDKIERCPVCGSQAKLWQYSTSPTAPRQLVVMCEHGDPIGPQDGIKNEGCLLYMPPDGFYQERIASAVRYWNDFARALTAMRTPGVALPAKPFPAPGKWFPVDITGTRPMREVSPGKWELAEWPSDGVATDQPNRKDGNG